MCWLPAGGRKGSCRGKLHPTVQSQLAVVCWLARQGTAEAHPSSHGSTGSQGSSRFHSLISSTLHRRCRATAAQKGFPASQPPQPRRR